MLAGSIVTAMPLAIVGGVFAEAWNLRVVTLVSEVIKIELFRSEQDVDDPQQGFALFGAKPTQVLAFPGFRATLKSRFHLNEREIRKVWSMVDKDESGAIDFLEFSAMFFPDVHVEHATVAKPAAIPGKELQLEDDNVKPLKLASEGVTSMEQRINALDHKLTKLASSNELVLASLESLQKSVLEAISSK